VEQKSAPLISDVAGDVVRVRGRNPNRKRDIFNFDSRQLQKDRLPSMTTWSRMRIRVHRSPANRSLTLELLASIMSDSLKIRFVFLCGLRRYHEYRSTWTPTLHEVLQAKQESGNAYHCFAIACTKKLPSRLTESFIEDATDSILQRLKEPEDCGEDTDSNSDLDIDHA